MMRYSCHSERSEESPDLFETHTPHKEGGFTLVELLVAAAITAILGAIIVAIFAGTLRGSNKAQILAVIKQNGQAVLEDLDKDIRSADNILCPVSGSSDTLVIEKDGCYMRYRFVAPSPSPNPVQNGQIQVDYPHPNPSANPCRINFPTPSPTSTTWFVNNVCIEPMVNPKILTDTNTQLGVSVDRLTGSSGLFTKSAEDGYRDSVTMSFILNPGVAVPPVLSGQIDPVTFQTTIQLR